MWTGTVLILLGGYDGSYFGGGASYDPLTDSWVHPSLWWDRSSPGVVWTGDFVIVWGGGQKGYNYWNEGAKLDPITRTGSRIYFPGGEENPGPILAGSVVLFGRENGDHLRYDPRTETWSDVSKVGAPKKLTGSTVWTGREVIFWNPPSPSSPGSGSGSRYEPATDTWAPVSIAGSPPLGAGSSTVWADREMIVWGTREDGGRFVSDGARYNPVTDSWAPMSLQGAPSPRGGHSAVWTGTEMVIWGGAALLPERRWPGPSLNTGGRYDPATDSWLPTTTRDAPPPFDYHRAFWADPVMLIWGGRGAVTAGGRYYPSIRRDLDNDGFTACEGDCDEREAAVSPAGIDLPGNYLDEDCDGVAACDPREAKNRGQLVSCVVRECGALVRSGSVDASICSEALSKTTRRAACGNGVLEGVELCDGAEVRERTCQAWGFAGGELRCGDRCDGFDLSGCVGCGDGVRRFPEECDGDDLDGLSCQDLGIEAGVLSCDGACRFDVSACYAVCGSGSRSGAEACDGSDLDGRTCQDEGFYRGALACQSDCSAYDQAGCQGQCGDGKREGAEQCDGSDVAGRTCQMLGFDAGVVRCTPWCEQDLSDCHFVCGNNCPGRCGNGVRESGESCDGSDLGGQSCRDAGFDSGILGCSGSCRLSVSQCAVKCGNGIKGGAEVCDKLDVGNAQCSDFGFNMGKVLCNSTCTAYNLLACSTCGDGIWEGLEVCDGPDLGGETCVSKGQPPGTLQCNATCNGFIYTGCTGP